MRVMVRGRGMTKGAIAAEAWRSLLDLSMSQRARFFAILSEFGLTLGDFRALARLEPDAPQPMGALAHAWECDASNVTWMVDQLEERGLVERRTFTSDRRVKTVALTALGEKTKAELLRRFYAPPDDLVALPYGQLVVLRDALATLPTPSPP